MTEEQFEEYCPNCDEVTMHRDIEDDMFDVAAECTKCHTVWEMEEDIEDDEEDA